MHKWMIETDNDRECYRILTEEFVQEHDGVPERVWIADVFDYKDALEIVNSHNNLIKT